MNKALTLLSAIALLLTISSCHPNLEACFGYSFTGNTASFNAQCSSRADEYEWDFGDGSSSKEQNPNHTFTESGTFEIELTVRSKSGFKDKFSETIEVDVCELTCQAGQCVSGNCDCDPGYEGNFCEFAFNEKFVGRYISNENCTPNGGHSGIVLVEKGATPTVIEITGLYGNGTNYITADLASNGRHFSAQRQPFSNAWDIEIYSGGITTTEEIQMLYRFYTIGTNNIIEECSISLQK